MSARVRAPVFLPLLTEVLEGIRASGLETGWLLMIRVARFWKAGSTGRRRGGVGWGGANENKVSIKGSTEKRAHVHVPEEHMNSRAGNNHVF